MQDKAHLTRFLCGCTIAALMVLSPYAPAFDPATGIALSSGFATAKSGSGKSGSGGGNSGSGGSGGGSDDHGDRDDDDDDDRDGRDDDDDDDDDDLSHRDGSRSGRDRARSGNGSSSSRVGLSKIETSANGIEVRYSDGTKEEIENGRYERKNAQNRTVEERPATGTDLARLRSLANGVSITSVSQRRAGGGGGSTAAGSTPSRLERQGGNLEVTYTNGWKEEIEAGRYELKDPFNRTVVERPATNRDKARLSALFGR